MAKKIYDIPFRYPTSLSDFICKDGEIEGADNVTLTTSEESSSATGNLPLPFQTLPPEPDISFGIVRDVLNGWHLAPDMYPSKTLSASSPSIEYWNKMAGIFLSQFQTEAISQNRFVAPFYVMAVWKTFDGIYHSPTEPVLLTPNSEAPLITTDGDTSVSELELKVAGAVATLYSKFKTDENLRDWVGKIESLEIFVSEPAHFYDTRDVLLPLKRVATESFGIYLDPASGNFSKSRICSETLPLAWKAKTYIKTKPEELSFFPFASVLLSEVDTMTSWKQLQSITDIDNRKSFKIADIKNPQGKSFQSDIVTVTGKDLEFSVTTRPVKLSGAGNFKKIRKAFLRGNFTPSRITFSAYASRDMQNWWKVSSANSSFLLLPDSFFRFYKIKITGFLSSSQSLQGITLQ